jgi:hypothetical protein
MIELRGEGLRIKCDVCFNDGGWSFEHVYDQIDDDLIETCYTCTLCGADIIGTFTTDEWFGEENNSLIEDEGGRDD